MKKMIALVTFSAIALTVSAQELINGSKVTDNWSVGLNAGGVTPLTHNPFWKSMRPVMGVELGKQLTPIFALGLEGMWSVNTSRSSTVFDHSNVSLLGKVNLNNLFGGYLGTPRPFEIEAVAGPGWLHSYVNGQGDDNFISTKVGLNFNFNLGAEKAWTIALKPALVYNLDGNTMPGQGRFNANHAGVELTAGLIYHFKGSNGKHHMTLERPYNRSEVNRLNAEINELRVQAQEAADAKNSLDAANRQIAQLLGELDYCRNQKPALKTVTKTNQTLESVVTFRQGKTLVDASQLPNVERIATYMKGHPESTVVIKGYASPEGSAEVNAKIASQRADAVKALLVTKYKIEVSRIVAEGQGVGDLFSEPDWNRVSICTLNESE